MKAVRLMTVALYWCIVAVLIVSISVLHAADDFKLRARLRRANTTYHHIIDLANMPAVQKEVGLDAQEIERVKELKGDLQQEQRDDATQAGRLAGLQYGMIISRKDLTDEQKDDKIAEVHLQAIEHHRKRMLRYATRLRRALPEAKFKRVQQIWWQAISSEALEHPEIRNSLQLTEKQQDTIAKSTEKYVREDHRLNQDFRGEISKEREVEFVKRLNEMSVEREAKSFGTLTEAQKAKYQALVGKPFDFGQMKSAPAKNP